MLQPTDIEAAVAEIQALTESNQQKIAELAQYGVQVQHNIPLVVLADMLLGTADTGDLLISTGPTPRLFFERRVQEVLAEQLDKAREQVLAEIRKQHLMQGVHSQQVPADVASLIVTGR